MQTYTTYGSVRRSCGHRHRTIYTALQCVERDARGCASQGGYSDRYVTRSDGSPLSEEEDRLLRDMQEAPR